MIIKLKEIIDVTIFPDDMHETRSNEISESVSRAVASKIHGEVVEGEISLIPPKGSSVNIAEKVSYNFPLHKNCIVIFSVDEESDRETFSAYQIVLFEL